MRGWPFPAVAWRLFRFSIAAAAFAACSLEGADIISYGPSDGVDGSVADSSAFDSGSTLDAQPSSDGSANDGATLDAAIDAGCGLPSISGGSLVAYPSTKTKTIDGMDSDWGCEAPFDLNSTTAGLKKSPDGGYEVSGACRFEWTSSTLYVICNITDPSPNDGTDSNLTNNDALEVYASGSLLRGGNYGTDDHQYVADWRGMKAEYALGTAQPTPTAFTVKQSSYSGGYVIEASIDASALLVTSTLTSGTTLAFDLQIDDGVGQPIAILWVQGTHGVCTTCTGACCCSGTGGGGDLPYCDDLAFGSLTIHP